MGDEKGEEKIHVKVDQIIPFDDTGFLIRSFIFMPLIFRLWSNVHDLVKIARRKNNVREKCKELGVISDELNVMKKVFLAIYLLGIS